MLYIAPGSSSLALPILLYIDPGSGALLWQTMLAAVLGVSYYLRSWFQRTASRLFRRR